MFEPSVNGEKSVRIGRPDQRRRKRREWKPIATRQRREARRSQTNTPNIWPAGSTRTWVKLIMAIWPLG